MNNKNLTKKSSIKLLSFDIDNTLIEFQTLKSNFGNVWNSYKSETDVLLTYNTGRLIDDVLSLVKKGVFTKT